MRSALIFGASLAVLGSFGTLLGVDGSRIYLTVGVVLMVVPGAIACLVWGASAFVGWLEEPPVKRGGRLNRGHIRRVGAGPVPRHGRSGT
jgi:hypothetical protein